MTNIRGFHPVAWVRRTLEVEIVRFGLIGGINTLVGYGLFVALQLSLGQVLQYTVVQAIANVIATIQAYWLQRWLVFRHKGNWWAGLVKFASVYVGAFFFSLAMVAVLVELFKMNVLVAGAVTVVLQAFGTYAANKWFTFRSGKDDGDTPTRPEQASEAGNDGPTARWAHTTTVEGIG